MTSSNSFLNDTKIETVNIKFATSILNETITKLSLFQCAKRTDIQKDDESKNTISPTTMKFGNDVDDIKRTFYKIIRQLNDHHNFTDFSGVSAAEKESEFLIEYSSNKAKLKQQCAALLKLEESIANYRTPIATVDENVLKSTIKNRFIKTWEKARRDQNDHYNRMLIGSLQNTVDNYSRNIELEKRCMLEIETYSLSEMEMHKEESTRWSEKFDVDINRTEIDIQVATAELEGMKMNYENTVEAIKRRVQEMIDFVALKEERVLQKDSDLMKLIYVHRDHLFAKRKIFSELI